MKISGFSMVKNATKLYYPIRQAIESILPICDEFILALGDCDDDDKTRDEVLSIGSEKIQIIDTIWDLEKYSRGTENAHQTDIAKQSCSGDWVFYVQADEVIHEDDHEVIVNACNKYLNNDKIEGLLFKYLHFWGDYNHYHTTHGWYKNEIRIVKNNPDIHSWESAQSFRRIPNFDYVNYRQQKNTFKLNVKEIDAYIYHYGWVRPPKYMRNKKKALDIIHKGNKKVDSLYENIAEEFDYGPLDKISIFDGSHPKVMESWISKFDWEDKLYFDGNLRTDRDLFKHEKNKYKLITFLENVLFNGKELFGHKNWNKV